MDQPADKTVDVTVIIVTYNSRKHIGACLDSICEKTSGVDYEVTVVDNQSADSTPAFVRENYPDVTLIVNPENVGLGAANNAAIRRSNAEFVFMLNPDTFLVNNAIRIFYDCMKDPANARIAVCGGQLLSHDNELSYSYDYFPNEFRDFMNRISGRPTSLAIKQEDGVHVIDGYVCGADFFARREVLEEAGLFDEDFFLYFEETELCFRIAGKGYRCAFVPAAKISHYVGASMEESPDRPRGIIRKSELLFYKKCYGYLSKEFLAHLIARLLRRIIPGF